MPRTPKAVSIPGEDQDNEPIQDVVQDAPNVGADPEYKHIANHPRGTTLNANFEPTTGGDAVYRVDDVILPSGKKFSAAAVPLEG